VKFSLIILFFLLSVTIESLAERCSYVNLSNHFGTPYDQQDIGWCYAYSGSDLLTYKYRNVLGGQAVSPIHMALLQNLSDAERVSAEAGTVRNAIRFATYRFNETETSSFFKGLCLATVDAAVIDMRAKIGVKKQFAQLGLLKSEYDKVLPNGTNAGFIDYYAKIYLENPLISRLDVKTLQNLMQNSRSTEIGIKYLDIFCPYASRFKAPENEVAIYRYVGGEYATVPPKGPVVYTQIKDSHQILEMVHEQIDKKNVSSISYFPEFLSGAYQGQGVLHASTIVGREFLRNSCHIIVRNSWGGCLDKQGKQKYSNAVTKCENGYLWVPENRLLPHLDGITYLK